jgi:hypothetical protein
MSVVFFRALDRHIHQLEQRLAGRADGGAVERRVAAIHALLKDPELDGRFRTALLTQVQNLEATGTLPGDEALAQRLAELTRLRDKLARIPEYQAPGHTTRRGR